MERETPRSSSRAGLDVFASLVVAFELAVAQPLLDLLGRNGEFFVARSSPPSDIIWVVCGLALILPVIGASLVVVIRRAHRPTGTFLHIAGLGGLLALLALQILKRAEGPGVLLVVVALLVGALLTFAYLRSETLHTVVRFALPLPLLVAGVALFGSQMTKLVLDGGAVPAGVQGVVIRHPAPVVFVSFDEFPLASLMDDRGRIDARLYPNFARLAGDSTWFRNTTAVGEFTDKAQPPIFTGNFPDNKKLPIVGDHPRNIFTLLGRSYDVHAQEPITRLCPVQVCASSQQKVVRAGARWRSLLSDLRVIAYHVFLPDDLIKNIPSIDHAWGNFVAEAGGGGATYTAKNRAEALLENFQAAVDADRRIAFDQFLSTIKPTKKPTLFFTHTILPHGTWEFLRSGHRYPIPRGAPGRTQGNNWSDDAWLTTQAYQHHLRQTEFVDTLIGRMVSRLKQADLYDRSLIVITADHGGAFTPGLSRRSLTSKTIGEIAHVPFFIKRPGQSEGAIDDRPTEVIDILPAVAEVLGVENMWKTDGVSAFRLDPASRLTKQLNNNKGRIVTFPSTLEKLNLAVARKYRLFARAGHSIDPWRTAPYGDLVGKKVSAIAVRAGSGGSIGRPSLEEGNLPTVVTGTAGKDGRFVALAVDGIVRSVTRAYSGGRYAFLLPEGTIHRGSNRLELFQIDGPSLVRRLGGTTASY